MTPFEEFRYKYSQEKPYFTGNPDELAYDFFRAGQDSKLRECLPYMDHKPDCGTNRDLSVTDLVTGSGRYDCDCDLERVKEQGMDTRTPEMRAEEEERMKAFKKDFVRQAQEGKTSEHDFVCPCCGEWIIVEISLPTDGTLLWATVKEIVKE